MFIYHILEAIVDIQIKLQVSSSTILLFPIWTSDGI
jgi:hypothetical protein